MLVLSAALRLARAGRVNQHAPPSVEGSPNPTWPTAFAFFCNPDRPKPRHRERHGPGGSRMESYGDNRDRTCWSHLSFQGLAHFPSRTANSLRAGFRNNGSTATTDQQFSTSRRANDNRSWSLRREPTRDELLIPAKISIPNDGGAHEWKKGENDPSTAVKRLCPAMFQWHRYRKETIVARSDTKRPHRDLGRFKPDRLPSRQRGWSSPGISTSTVRYAGADTFGRFPLPSARCRAMDGRATLMASTASLCAARRLADRSCRLSQFRRAAGPMRRHCPPCPTSWRDAQRAAAHELGFFSRRPGGAGVRRTDVPARSRRDYLRRHREAGRLGRARARPLIDVVDILWRRPGRPPIWTELRSEEPMPSARLAAPQGFRFRAVVLPSPGRLALFFRFATPTERVRRPTLMAASQRYTPPRQAARSHLPSGGRAAARRDPGAAGGGSDAEGFHAARRPHEAARVHPSPA